MRKERDILKVSQLETNNGQLGWLPKNPRQWTQTDIDRTKASIQEDTDFLEDRPLLVCPGLAGKYVVFGGNLRLTAARSLKLKEVPVVVYCLDEGGPEQDEIRETIKRRAMKDNGSFGSFDYDLLANEWDDLPLADWGVPAWEGEAEPAAPEVKEDDFNEDAEVETRCNPGDIWQLGDHRLMCGDSTDANDVERLMNGSRAVLALTDPPYGICVVTKKERITDEGIGGGGALHFRQGIGGGNIVRGNDYAPVIGDDTTETAEKSYALMKELTDNQIIFGGNYFTAFLPPRRCWLVWDKRNGANDFADCELAWTSFDKSVRKYEWLWNGLAREGNRDEEGQKRVHPTQKPVGLLKAVLADYSTENDAVLDLFGGSGSTLIACEQMGRKCYMMELDEHYCDVILARWETFTGKTAQLITPGDKVS